MMSTKAHAIERSLPGKYETTALISEEGIRSEASMQNVASFRDFLNNEKNVEEFHFLQVQLCKRRHEVLLGLEPAEKRIT